MVRAKELLDVENEIKEKEKTKIDFLERLEK